jgi:uncharacterized membrane protein
MLKRITYINSVIAVCTAIIGLVFIVLENPEEFKSSENWGMAFLFAILFVIFVAGMTQLVGRAVRKAASATWALRLGIVISVIWFLTCAVLIEPLAYDSLYDSYYNLSKFLAIGVIPLVLFLGLVWVVKAIAMPDETNG